MEPEEVYYVAEEYVRTTTSNLISRKATVHGAQNVSLKGKGIVMPGVTIFGDLAPIKFGRYCLVGENTVMKPGSRLERTGHGGGDGDAAAAVTLSCQHTPMLVGNYTHVGRGCVVQAAAIGCNVSVGDNAVLGANCIIKDNCVIEAGAVVPAGTVVPPFTRVSGGPGRAVAELPESHAALQPERAMAFYNNFKKST